MQRLQTFYFSHVLHVFYVFLFQRFYIYASRPGGHVTGRLVTIFFKCVHCVAPLVTGAVADKWYVSLPPQVHLSTVVADDRESPCCDVSSDVSDDFMESPCYCQQEQQQGTGQYEILTVT